MALALGTNRLPRAAGRAPDGEGRTPTRTDRRVRLPDGRALGYATYGSPSGQPLFLFHGMPGSRLLRHPDPSIAEGLDVHLIVPDRPGMGLSDPQPRRRFRHWADDVRALADPLGIERFAVLGISAGGPYAAACGHALADRVSVVGMVSGVGPLEAPGVLDGMLSTNRLGYAVGRWTPWPLWRWVFRLYYGDVHNHPEKLVDVNEEEPSIDQTILRESGLRPILTEAFAEAFRQGSDGPARDAWLLTRPWGFELETVRVPVHLWQGEADVVVTPVMARHMHRRLPHSQARHLPGQGHLLWVTHWEEILADIICAP